jgi:hypothetical protein
MKRSWTALAVALVAIFASAGCNDYGNTFQNNTGAILAFLSPANLPAGGPAFTITMNGNGFVAKTRVQWNGTTCPLSTSSSGGSPCTTTVTLDSNNNVLSVTASIPASFIAKPGIAAVNTINPASGTGQNGLSNTINFIINNPPNPVPTVSSVSPACVVAGNSLALTVTGTNFLTGPTNTTPAQVSTLTWTLGATSAQFTAPTATITSTQITVTIPNADIAAAGSANVTVSNPPSLPVANIPGSTGSGGGTSSPAAVVTVQPTTGVCPAAVRGQNTAEGSTVAAEETPAISRDGRYVAYTAVQGGHSQIFFRDTCENAPSGCQPLTSLISVSSEGSAATDDSHSPSMSSDGRYLAFSSVAPNLVEGAPPGRQIYLRDTCVGAGDSCKPSTTLVSTDSGGALVGTESVLPSVSSSGRFVAFLAVTPSHSASSASPEAKSQANSTNSGYRQVFVRDTCLGATNCSPKTTRISLHPGDGSATLAKPAGPALSNNAGHVAISGGNAATLFTRSVAVDDSVFLAITNPR